MADMSLIPKEKLKIIDDLDYQISKLQTEDTELEKKHYHFGDLTKGVVSKIK